MHLHNRFIGCIALLLLAFVGLPVFAQDHPAGTREMSAEEYKSYLQKYDEMVTRWKYLFDSIDIKQAESGAQREEATAIRKSVLKQLEILHSLVAKERMQPKLWRQIVMVVGFAPIPQNFGVLLSTLPQSRGQQWVGIYDKLDPETQTLLGPLIQHIQARADALESK